MEFTEELRLSILSLWHEAHDKDMDSFCKLLKEKAEKLGISYNVLLQLVFDKKYLFFEVLPKVEEIDRKVSDLQKQIDELEHQKMLLGKMICEMHGHTISNYEAFGTNLQHCVICGEDVRLDNENGFLRKRDELKRGFYPKK